MIFVRHGRAIAKPDVPTHDWPLDPEHSDAIRQLRAVMPDLPVVCSAMRRVVDTARFFGEPTLDPRLAEVSRPWSDDLEDAVTRYLRGEVLEGWETQADATARVRAVVEERGRAVYVTHGTVLSCYLAAVVPGLDAVRFWSGLTSPDACLLDGDRIAWLPAA